MHIKNFQFHVNNSIISWRFGTDSLSPLESNNPCKLGVPESFAISFFTSIHGACIRSTNMAGETFKHVYLVKLNFGKWDMRTGDLTIIFIFSCI